MHVAGATERVSCNFAKSIAVVSRMYRNIAAQVVDGPSFVVHAFLAQDSAARGLTGRPGRSADVEHGVVFTMQLPLFAAPPCLEI